MPLLESSSRGQAIVHKAFRLSVLMWLVAVSPATAEDNNCLNDYRTCTEAQTKELESRALTGDGRVAMRLSNTPTFTAKEKRFWLTISAENGYPGGILELGAALREDDSDPRNIIRAKYWLNIVKAQYPDNKMVILELCRLDRKTQTPPPACDFQFLDAIEPYKE
jgi:hypothetical protein